ncbi:hypothetical protein [Lysobacter sp. A3-1-A15]|uniref:hypothetical protein n=1 Tax=Novilysobacter viscosus TaxID=3098602 RepID=UPI002ED9E37C
MAMRPLLLRPLLLLALIGLASLATFHAPNAQAQGYVSISIGHPAPPRYRHHGHGHGHHRPGYAWVPGQWVWTGYREVWHPGHYVRLQPSHYGSYGGYGGYGGYGYQPPRRTVHRHGYPYRPAYGTHRPGYRVVYRRPVRGW